MSFSRRRRKGTRSLSSRFTPVSQACTVTQRFVEMLARFRPDLSLLAEMDAIEGENDLVPLGMLPRNWLDARTMRVA